MEPIILASGSPRRQELLQQIGVPFVVVKSDAEEILNHADGPRALAIENARRKALAVAKMHPGRIVLGADTVVFQDGEVYGKPKDAADACAMLRRFAGRRHAVVTGIALVSRDGTCRTDAAETNVCFADMMDEEITAYVATGEPMDKAGAYAVQGRAAAFIPRIEGSFSSVVGLPLYEVITLLKAAGAM
ncbi:Maf family protein [Selenomonas sp.]|uniref:Maf family protein n=1 Tax=Selenomonas sp. TaxID=2053611 RepID=UPI002A8327E3|nr:Maf family protein [Selenomonas sp.]MDY4415150.1 Maf family protein [Selenomonas sp.]